MAFMSTIDTNEHNSIKHEGIYKTKINVRANFKEYVN